VFSSVPPANSHISQPIQHTSVTCRCTLIPSGDSPFLDYLLSLAPCGPCERCEELGGAFATTVEPRADCDRVPTGKNG
jgi:hypothetical protein